MNDSTRREFMEITGCDATAAAGMLAAAGGDLDAAVALHFEAVEDEHVPPSSALPEAEVERVRVEVEAERDLRAAHTVAGPSLLDQLREAERKQEELLDADAKLSKTVQRAEGCMVCGRWEETDNNPMLACDKVGKRKGSKKRRRCDQLCHLQCCSPPLRQVPGGAWHCSECAVASS